MSAAVSYFARQAAVPPEKFWLAVDERLVELGQPEALWIEELADLYRGGISIPVTVRIVLARRRVRS